MKRLDTAKWFWSDAIWRYRAHVLLVLGLSGLGILCQLGAFSMVLVYANALETGEAVSLLGRAFSARTSPALVAGVGVGTFLLLLLFSILTYVSKTRAIALRRSYTEYAAKRIVVLASHLPHPSCPQASSSLAPPVMRHLSGRAAQSVARIQQVVLDAIVPMGRLVVALGVILYISFIFSLFVIALAAVSAVLIYRISKSAAKIPKLGKRHGIRANAEQQRLYRRIWVNPSPVSYDDRVLTDMYRDGGMAQSLDVLFSRYILKEKAALVTNGLSTAAMFLILIVAGAGVVAGTWSWSILAAYLVALRYFLSSSATMGRLGVRIGRYYPYIREYAEFVTDAEQAPASDVTCPEQPRLSLDTPSLNGENDTLTLRAGDRAYLFHPGSPDRFVATMLQSRTVTQNGSDVLTYWFAGNMEQSGFSLRECHGFPESLDDNQLKAELAKLPFMRDEDVCSLPQLNEVLSDQSLEHITPAIDRGLRLLSAVYAKRPVVVFRGEDMQGCGDEIVLPTELDNRIVIIACQDRSNLHAAADAAMISLSDGVDLKGWCTAGWMRQHPQRFDEVSKPAVRADAASTGYGYEDDEDDME